MVYLKNVTIRQSWRERDARQGKTVQTASVMLAIYMVCRVAKLVKAATSVVATE